MYWNEIGRKYNKLVELLKERGFIDELDVISLFTEDYKISTYYVCFTIIYNNLFPLFSLFQTPYLNIFFYPFIFPTIP